VAHAQDKNPVPWCVINPTTVRQGRSIQLANNNIHVVVEPEQLRAQQRLAQKNFVGISRDEALRLIANGSVPSVGAHNYLVRASAFYVDQNYAIGSSLTAYFYPDESIAEIVNLSLSQSGAAPTNLAVIITTDAEINGVEVICRTAA